MAEQDLVEVEHRGGIAQVVLSDPQRRNVLSGPMIDALLDAYDHAEADPGIRCVVLAAHGPAFCAGAELEVLEKSAAGDFSGIERVYRAFLRVAESALPTIAVVDGPAVGAGFNLALACDLRTASAGAVFDSRFTALRLLPGGGHVWLLERAVGRQAATAMALFGERIGADDAHRLGLVWSVSATPEDALEQARALAGRVAGVEREFVTTLVGSLRDAASVGSHDLAVTGERYTQRWSVTRPDFLSGVRNMRARVERADRRER
ncbi:enoyl-CoA hydratase-related protein [Streptomyces sp. NPDC057257]|uniref:enoyl-CoA hydratase-related protein n=1 Tax=Streptomyces sp. NPDC057257 TaxID=3346071 RepID=UPI00362F7DEE